MPAGLADYLSVPVAGYLCTCLQLLEGSVREMQTLTSEDFPNEVSASGAGSP
jgi:hypothetical protein